MANLSDKLSLIHSRHLLLNEIDESKVSKIINSKILIIGAGGLGCPAAQYLVSSGVQNIIWVDHDKVEESNLPRQILYGPDDVNKFKVEVGKNILKKINPCLKIKTITSRANKSNIRPWVIESDIVLDCTDRFSTRFLINEVCCKEKTPLIISSAIQWCGQLMIVNPLEKDCACYSCVFGSIENNKNDVPCGAYGVFSTAVGIMGLLQANEALKFISGVNSTINKLILFDGKKLDLDYINLKKNKSCSICHF